MLAQLKYRASCRHKGIRSVRQVLVDGNHVNVTSMAAIDRGSGAASDRIDCH